MELVPLVNWLELGWEGVVVEVGTELLLIGGKTKLTAALVGGVLTIQSSLPSVQAVKSSEPASKAVAARAPLPFNR